MDRRRSPFVPGAGLQPPDLAGRGRLLVDTSIDMDRVLAGRCIALDDVKQSTSGRDIAARLRGRRPATLNTFARPRGTLLGLVVDAGIGDRPPGSGTWVAINIQLHDLQDCWNQGGHDPAAIMHLRLAPTFRKGRTAVEHLVPERIEPVKDDSQYPVNIPFRKFSSYTCCLAFETFMPIITFRLTLYPLPERCKYVLVLQKNTNRAGKRVPNDTLNFVSRISFQYLPKEVAELSPLGQILRIRCIRSISRVERDPQKDELLSFGGGLFTSVEPAPGPPHSVFIVPALGNPVSSSCNPAHDCKSWFTERREAGNASQPHQVLVSTPSMVAMALSRPV